MTSSERGSSARRRLTKMLLKSIASRFGVSWLLNCSASHSQALKPYELPPRVIFDTFDRSKEPVADAARNAALTSSAESNFLASALTTKWCS